MQVPEPRAMAVAGTTEQPGKAAVTTNGHLELTANASSQHIATLEAKPVKPTPLPPIVRQHDIFNLVCIFMLIYFNTMYILGRSGPEMLLYASTAYFAADMVFVAIWPLSVKAPTVILGHHVLALGLLAVPYVYPMPEAYQGLSDCMLVELNTWFLISKRTIPYLKIFQEVMFYATWVGLRLIWYPYLCYVRLQEFDDLSEQLGTHWNWGISVLSLQFFLTGLNFYWTASLFTRKKRKTTDKAKEA